jgi:DNA-binding NarL/FixJ family response regulator
MRNACCCLECGQTGGHLVTSRSDESVVVMRPEQSDLGVFLLAESRLLRDLFARVLARKGDIRIVGIAAPSSESLSKLIAANPDVVLCDSLAAVSRDELLPEVRRSLPSASVVMFGMDTDHETFLAAVHHGASGYILKDASATDVASAIRAVANGESVCPPALCRVLFDYVANSQSWHPGAQVRQNLGLTRREQQLVQLLSEGLTNKEIAAQFDLSEQTVKNHVRRMLRKVGAKHRLEAIERWRELGFWT